tara:strand:- start:524 stop:871 length:348 start_codon:yes stop_codon:yes gene_type:complete
LQKIRNDQNNERKTMTTYKSAYKTTTFVEDKKINVVHHATKIIEHDVENNTIKLNNGGWYSKTTKDRMHSYLIENANYRLYQKKGNWFLDQVDKLNDYKTIKTIPYENNMILEVK